MTHVFGEFLTEFQTVLVLFFLGSRLFGRRAGLLAAAFYTFAVLPVQ